MNDFLNKMERKHGGKAIPRLTTIMIALMAAGYILALVRPDILNYLTLDPDRILHLEIWRLVTWVLIPPGTLDFFTIIMLVFYLSIGMSLERAWGDFRYNVYIFSGLLISIVAAFLAFAIFSVMYHAPALVGAVTGSSFSTYYICMSILLAYAATFPEAVVLFMFVIPVKMKYFGFIYAAFMLYDVFGYIRAAATGGGPLYLIRVVAMAASLVNFALFFFTSRQRFRLNPEQKRRQREFRRQVLQAEGRRGGSAPQGAAHGGETGKVTRVGARHRCEICGRTEISDPDLEFRYCSKCQGAHEYCLEHLYTHVHILPPSDRSPESGEDSPQA